MFDHEAAAPSQKASVVIRYLDRVSQDLLTPDQGLRLDFSKPVGEEALTAAGSVSWRVFRNPISLYIGGVTAVLMELAEPRVRSGVWDHSSFRTDPMSRMKRTGLAAMVTVYGAQSEARRMIAAIVALHGQVSGLTPSGDAYGANDPELLDWVQATASFGFVEAYSAYVRPLSDADRNQFLIEAMPAARLYGAVGAPTSLAQRQALFDAMLPRLEASDIVFEFLGIMQKTKVFPPPFGALQYLLVRAGVALVPQSMRQKLGLGRAWGVSSWQHTLIAGLARMSDRLILPSSPPVQACRRLGLDPNVVFFNPDH
jgi:uncharacterized protein (DUF2236 family)